MAQLSELFWRAILNELFKWDFLLVNLVAGYFLLFYFCANVPVSGVPSSEEESYTSKLGKMGAVACIETCLSESLFISELNPSSSILLRGVSRCSALIFSRF